jgi:hypothetical protein
MLGRWNNKSGKEIAWSTKYTHSIQWHSSSLPNDETIFCVQIKSKNHPSLLQLASSCIQRRLPPRQLTVTLKFLLLRPGEFYTDFLKDLKKMELFVNAAFPNTISVFALVIINKSMDSSPMYNLDVHMGTESVRKVYVSLTRPCRNGFRSS